MKRRQQTQFLTKQQVCIINRMNGGEMLIKHKEGYRAYFTLGGDRIHAKVPLSMIRNGYLAKTENKGLISHYSITNKF